MCFSPERVDPGNPKYQTKNIPKVVGGITPACTEIGALFYRQALDTVVPVGSTRDPFYLSWKTKQAGIEARFIELAGYINGQMPHFVVDKIQNALNDHTKPLKGSRVHVMGVSYKRDIDDVRESPALDIIHLLGRRGALISYSDPFVVQIQSDGIEMQAVGAEAAIRDADCVVIVTDHKKFDYAALVKNARLIVDTRNVLKGIQSDKIVRL